MKLILLLCSFQICSFISLGQTPDFRESKPIEIFRNKLVYYRTGNEALLEIYSSDRKSLIQTHSLALEKSELDLKEIENGRYILKIIDYSSNESEFCELIISKS